MTSEAKAAPAAAHAHKRQLRNLLLDKSYQLRYTAVIVLISAALTGGLGYLVAFKTDEATRVIMPQLALLPDQEAVQVKATLRQGDLVMKLAIVGFGVIFCVAMMGYGIVITHKVAGPLYKLSVYLNQIRDGHLGTIYNLRRGDQLHAFYAVFRQMHESLRQRTKNEIEVLDRVIAEVEKNAGESEEGKQSLEDLRTLRRTKEESLG